ncbi:hypothetical protein GCM10010425_54100 [Streptomyces spororaveus]|uniref:Uncharacterized protein n=1 Tax=Streptomyces spororaveus TaxID=284039 RepID=A0ABQ3T3S9_9ACTN|nr:hypothetical protein Sspor_06110 [Streptomyces spororaveus]
MTLRPPVEPMLAQAVESVPGPGPGAGALGASRGRPSEEEKWTVVS